jgi:hypothetical protein
MKNMIIVLFLFTPNFIFRQLDYNTIETTSTLSILEYLLTNKLFNMKKDFNPSRFPGHRLLPGQTLEILLHGQK